MNCSDYEHTWKLLIYTKENAYVYRGKTYTYKGKYIGLQNETSIIIFMFCQHIA